MKHHRYRSSSRWVLALITAGLLLATVPGSASAQRGRTDDGRRIERKGGDRAAKAKSRSGAVKRGSDRGGNARTGGTVGRGNDRQSGGTVGRGGNDRSGGAVRRGDHRAGKRGGNIVIDGDDRRDRDRRDREWDRRDRDWDRRERDRRDREWQRRDRDRRGGAVIFVPPGHAKKKYVPYHHRRARRSHVDVRVHWPWVIRYEQHWHPRVRARHVIHVDIGWGSSRRSARMEFETVYRQRVRHANRDYAVIDIDIEEVVIYRDGRYIGRVDRIPGHLSRATATVWRNGALEYDRDLFVVGNTFTGFELVSEEYLPNGRTRIRAGEVDLRTGRVYGVGRSRLYDPYAPDRFYVQSLLPEDVAW